MAAVTTGLEPGDDADAPHGPSGLSRHPLRVGRPRLTWTRMHLLTPSAECPREPGLPGR